MSETFPWSLYPTPEYKYNIIQTIGLSRVDNTDPESQTVKQPDKNP